MKLRFAKRNRSLWWSHYSKMCFFPLFYLLLFLPHLFLALIYEDVQALAQQHLCWGSHTGVRPVVGELSEASSASWITYLASFKVWTQLNCCSLWYFTHLRITVEPLKLWNDKLKNGNYAATKMLNLSVTSSQLCWIQTRNESTVKWIYMWAAQWKAGRI